MVYASYPTWVAATEKAGAADPVPLQLGVTAWWRADSLTVDGLVDNDPIPLWRDESGNGYDVSQGTLAKQPTYKTGIHASLPVVQPDGVDDVLFRLVTDWQSADSAFTVVFVYIHPYVSKFTQTLVNSSSDTLNDVFWHLGTNSGSGAAPRHLQMVAYDQPGAGFQDQANTGNEINDFPPTGGAGSAGWVDVRSTGARWEAEINNSGTLLYSTIDIGSNSGRHFTSYTSQRDNLSLFARRIFNGDSGFVKQDGSGGIGEIMYFDRDLSAADTTTLRAYMAGKWGTDP